MPEKCRTEERLQGFQLEQPEGWVPSPLPLLLPQMGKAVENSRAQLCPLSDVLVDVSTYKSGIHKGRLRSHGCEGGTEIVYGEG